MGKKNKFLTHIILFNKSCYPNLTINKMKIKPKTKVWKLMHNHPE